MPRRETSIAKHQTQNVNVLLGLESGAFPSITGYLALPLTGQEFAWRIGVNDSGESVTSVQSVTFLV